MTWRTKPEKKVTVRGKVKRDQQASIKVKQGKQEKKRNLDHFVDSHESLTSRCIRLGKRLPPHNDSVKP